MQENQSVQAHVGNTIIFVFPLSWVVFTGPAYITEDRTTLGISADLKRGGIPI
jgi:hypothetical protein